MKTIKYIFLVLLMIPLLTSCDEDSDEDEEPDRTNALLTLQNDTRFCLPTENITFIVSYRDIQVDVDVEEDRSAFLNVLVEDGESVNIKVQRTSDNTTLSDANVNVRTDSRPENLEGTARIVSYCDPFNLSFQNF